MMCYITFLRDECLLMVGKVQWEVLPYLVAKEIPELRLIPPIVKEEHYHWHK